MNCVCEFFDFYKNIFIHQTSKQRQSADLRINNNKNLFKHKWLFFFCLTKYK